MMGSPRVLTWGDTVRVAFLQDEAGSSILQGETTVSGHGTGSEASIWEET